MTAVGRGGGGKMRSVTMGPDKKLFERNTKAKQKDSRSIKVHYLFIE